MYTAGNDAQRLRQRIEETDAASMKATTISIRLLAARHESAAANRISLQSFSDQQTLALRYEENTTAPEKSLAELLFLDSTGFKNQHELPHGERALLGRGTEE